MPLDDYFTVMSPDDIRIKGTRVGIETVLYEFIHRGQSPEENVAQYPSLTLEQVYATITYYFREREDVSRYLSRWLEQGQRRRAEQAQNSPPVVAILRHVAAPRLGRRMTEFRFLLDETVGHVVRSAVRRTFREMVVWVVGEPGAPPLGTPEPEILGWCERHGYILSDQQSCFHAGASRQASGGRTPRAWDLRGCTGHGCWRDRSGAHSHRSRHTS